MPQWTKAQNDAITAKGRNILVSAAAGSGKTAVLVERVKQIITDKDNPVDIDKLLIVTFTNAAAAEMRYRISKSLNACIKKNPSEQFYRKQLSLLPNARICTIDAFCANLVKEHFYDLSINQDFSLFDESELQLLEDVIISDVLDDFFDRGDEAFISLVEAFTTPSNDKPIIAAVKKILRFIYAQPFPYIWLEKAIEKYNPNISFSDTAWYDYIKSQINYLIHLGVSLVKENISLVDFEDPKLNEKFIALFEDDLTEFTRFQTAFETSWDTLVNEREAAFTRLPPTSKIDSEISNQLKSNREIYKKLLKDEIPSFFVSDEHGYTQDMKTLSKQLNALCELVKEVDTRLMFEKKERNKFSFSDIEHFAIKLLFDIDKSGNIIKTNLADDLSNEFYEILVDEYQDTNEAQDLLFAYLSNGKNLFTVGDIKQSIYRFRLAMPHIFNERKKSYALYNSYDNELSSKIILDKNFRSRRDICSYVNFIFSNLMSEELGELEYNEEEYLNCGAQYKESNVPSAQIKIFDGVKGEDTDKKEATFIAKTIIEKVNSGELIKDGDSYRPIKYGDFAILMRSLKSHINNYSEILTEYGIPVVCDNSTNLFENNEIKMILSLLRAIDNPMQDIPLLATMLSPFYGFTADELADIKVNSNGRTLYSSVYNSDFDKVKNFTNDLSNLRKISVTMSVAGFIRYIVEEKGLIAYINAMGNAEQRYQNILKFISFAQSFDSGVNVGLTAFIRYIDKIISSDKSIESASLATGSQNAVTIMSVHHSKGLEFPVCIFAGTNRQYNKADLSDKLLLNTHYGIGIKCHNEEQLYQYNSIPYSVIKNKNVIELMSENLRVLYVALTRAKEQFITFITCDNLEGKLKRLSSNIINDEISPYMGRKINCDADFFLMCALFHKNGDILRDYIEKAIKVKHSEFELSIEITDEIELNEKQIEILPAKPDKEIINAISEKLKFTYSRKELENLSAKLTASALDNADKGFEYITSAKPAFMNKTGLTAAQRGTAMHSFMQYCIYENAKSDLNSEIDRLVSLSFITKEQADALDIKKLSAFFYSNFADRIFNADKIYREIKVSSFIKANEIYDTDFDDKILVQGIADCVFEENGELILLDYKTDRVSTADELLSRYKKQIQFYKSAVAKTLKKPVKQAALYSFCLEKICYYSSNIENQ
ncbi:MAG: helicase-exonuclease AddAB subunit AddA [Eubacterium sp.]|nr:helicase-exonuclease AddAB subunit AddA [Eubacterium sp.]